jgi:hypothetical protein
MTGLVTLGMLAGGSLAVSAPAFAAALEKPETGTPTEIKSETATLQGTLSPASIGEAESTYQFVYKASTKTECKGTGEIKAPASPATSAGSQAEAVSAPVTALKPGTEYAVCLVVHNKAKTEEPASTPATFTTVPSPVTEVPSPIGATTATFQGKLTPLNATVNAEYFFYYNLSNILTEPTPACTYESRTEPAEPAGVGAGTKDVSVPWTGLQPNHEYTVCLETTNEFGAAEQGPPVSFKTLPTPPEFILGSESASNVTSSGATLNAAINANNENTTYFFEYSTSEAEVLAHKGARVEGAPPAPELEGFGGQGASANVTGLQLDTTYYYRVIAENAQSKTEPKPAEGEVEPFTTSPTGPLVSTGATSELGQSSANVTGSVTPEGAETYYYYQYGPTTEYGQSTVPEGPGISVGAGLSAVPAPARLVPLTPGVTYHYRLVAWNEAGTSYGQDETFTAIAGQSPLAVTGPASGVAVSEATISGTIDPQGKETSYRFEYGTDTGYGTQAFGTVLPEQGVQTVALSLRGLDPGTTYHYRLVVSNPGGTSEGADQTFTTPGILDPLVNPATTPLIATPAIVFPKEEKGSGTTTKTLTNAQKLAAALKVCKKEKSKSKRARCKTQARKRYGPAKKTKKK